MNFPKIGKKGRYIACVLMVAVFFLVYEVQLFQWQIIRGEEFEQESLENQTDTIALEAARGEILDRNGKVLAGNRTSYNVVYNALNMVSEERNATIIKVIDLLTERGEKWRDRLPILLDENGNYRFAEDREDEIASLKSQDMLNLADYATAEDCMAELTEEYRCSGFSREDARNVCSVRYSMRRDGFSRTNPYVIAEDVSPETVGVINQMAGELKGIETRVSVARYYGEDGTLAAHVVGHMGALSSEQYQSAEENGTAYDYENNLSGYKWTDSMGQDGLEAAFEEELRGHRGLETIYSDDTGAVKSTAVTTQPQEGNTVHTTLDSDLQRVANLSLKKNIQGNTLAKDCTAGAAVVLDVKDFGVLTCASYPTYDMNLYNTDDKYVNQVLNDKENEPMYNRALQGEYVPGSVFKPMVALAALQEGVISAGTTYFCDKTYILGDDENTQLKLGCTDYHGNTNVYNGIAGSCNVFFCNVGVGLTIKKMDAYAQYFGLGEKTGVELYEEEGLMSNPQEYEEQHGTPWLDGASAQTAIGQADNMFTPIQLAAYCATMANGGKRLQTHFLDRITDYTGAEVVERYQPKELFDAGLSADVQGVVREGMRMVATEGTASNVFEDYPVSIACKTGTAENTEDHEENLSFICYAPADDPEIAVAVMIEYGNKGDYAKNVAKDILDQYFGFFTWDEEGNRYNQNGDLVDDEGKVLKTKEELDREREAQERQEAEDFLSSALEDGSEDPVSSAPESASQPEDSSGTGRNDIPSTPYTGEPVSSDPAESGLPQSTTTPAPQGKPESPYYTGKGQTSSGGG